MNTVTLLGYYGSDKTHSQSAWTSTNITTDDEIKIEKLLKFLAKNEHMTPFEKSTFHFNISTDIATHIHLLKHRIGVSINAESARYKEIKEDKIYIPQDWPVHLQNKLKEHSEQSLKLYHDVLEELTPICGRKRAKESARYFRTYNCQIISDVSFNWRSFYHFYCLRSSEHAQKEIQEIAITMLNLIKNIEGNPFKYTIDAFGL